MSDSTGSALRAEDIQAFTPVRGAALPARPPRRAWPWLLGGLLLALVLAGAATLAVLALADGARDGLHVIINGEPWGGSGADGIDWLFGLLGGGVAVFVVLLVVPLAVLFGLLMGGLGIALGLAATLGALGLVAALLLSPLCLLLLPLWLLLRRNRRSN